MIAAPRLLAIIPPELPVHVAQRWLPELHGCVDVVLLRWPDSSAREILARASALAALTRRPRLSLSDRLDLALAAGVEGVHLRDDGLSPTDVRSVAPHLQIGVSRHDARGILAAVGADYATLSPFAATRSKPQVAPLAREEFARICRSSPVPVLALGGLERSNAGDALCAGAQGVACIGAIWSTADPASAARALRAAIEERINASGAARYGDDRPAE